MNAKVLALMGTLISNMVALIILSLIIHILPNSPFQAVIEQYCSFTTLPKYLQLFYYFVPVDRIIAVFEMWAACILNYFIFEFFLKTAYNSSSGGVMKI